MDYREYKQHYARLGPPTEQRVLDSGYDQAFTWDGHVQECHPGWSFELLIGALGDDSSLPADLSERDDAYLSRTVEDQLRRSR